MKLYDFLFDEDYPGYFKLGFTGLLKDSLNDFTADQITLKIVRSNSEEVVMPPEWGRQGYASLIDDTGRFYGAIDDITFFKSYLKIGDVVTCPARRTKGYTELFVPLPDAYYKSLRATQA